MSKLADRLIRENKSTRAPFLDLGNCGLTEIPDEVRQLKWLDGLSLGTGWYESRDQFLTSTNRGRQNDISDLSPIAHLTGLRALHVSERL